MPERVSVSVVVPAYNRAALLPETLDAILSQTQPPVEVLVVDDGSTDDTAHVLASYGSRILVLSIQNSGDLVARNVGMRAATGTLVAFCDSDDVWEPDFLEQMGAFWTSGVHPFAAYSDFHVLENGTLSAQSKFQEAPHGYWDALEGQAGSAHRWFAKPILSALIDFQPLFASCIVADRERLLAAGGWDEGVSRKLGGDFATALRVAEHAPLGILCKPLVRIRRHVGNFSANIERMNLGDAEVLSYVLATRPSLQPYADEIRRSINQRRLEAFDSAFARGDYATANAIAAMVSSRDARHCIKRWIGRLPAPLRTVAWRYATGRTAS